MKLSRLTPVLFVVWLVFLDLFYRIGWENMAVVHCY